MALKEPTGRTLRRRSASAVATSAGGIERSTVTVCRGCCCGEQARHPGVDHDALLRHLRDQLEPASRVRVTDCLLVCGESNVVVVSPTPAARRDGARPVWLGRILSTAAQQCVVDWIHAGGPGVAPVPAPLRPHLSAPFAVPVHGS